MIIDVPWGLRHPRRLTVLAIAMEAPNAVFHVVRAAWAAAAQAEDRRRVSPGRGRIGSPAVGDGS